jgi:arylsulfatase A-like enzyme
MKPKILVFICAVIAIATSLVQASAKRPNILYFYVDDMGWGSIAPNGQAERKAEGLPHLITPTLDRLAAEGVNFSRGYGCTVCSPARSSQQTGFHQGHTFADQNNPDNAMKAIRTEDITMGDVLSEAGYVTGYWGKWGYGGSKDQPNPEILNIQTLPTSHGYQHVLAELHHVRAHTFFQPTLWKAPAAPGSRGGMELVPNAMERYMNRKDYPNEPALQNHPGYPETAYCDDMYAMAAMDFVRVQSQNYNTSGQPFFGLLAVQVPHSPFDEVEELPEWDKAYRNASFFNELQAQSKQWAAMISRIDGHFANILAALEDPNGDGDTSDSVADDTYVIFQSDNGGPGGKSRNEFNANGGLREVKGRIEEGGIRTPLMIRLAKNFSEKSSLKAGTSTDIILDVTDLLPTFCDLAGVETPLGVDGVSMAPTLTGKGHQRTRDFLIHEAGNGQSIIRGKDKLIRRKDGSFELYDLVADHAEAKDIASKHPGLVAELKALMLGERVDEPKGFSNTYHNWIGSNASLAHEADNWSNFVYANEGITYTTDDGAPQVSWTAHMINSGGEANHAVANKDLEFLALHIGGEQAAQSLVLDPYIQLTGRNEIRIANHGSLTVNQGKVSSLRWIEIANGGSLKGNGEIEGDVYNAGTLTSTDQLQLSADFRAAKKSTMTLAVSDEASLKVAGEAHLGGELSITLARRFKPKKGDSYAIVKASKIEGTFANAPKEIVATNGARFKVDYGKSSVTLTAL